jgi:hypothetical protein
MIARSQCRVKDSLYKLQGSETFVVRIAIVRGVQAQTEVFKFQLDQVRDISQESGLREEMQQVTKCPLPTSTPARLTVMLLGLPTVSDPQGFTGFGCAEGT